MPDVESEKCFRSSRTAVEKKELANVLSTEVGYGRECIPTAHARPWKGIHADTIR
jgi:hypothetical protein